MLQSNRISADVSVPVLSVHSTVIAPRSWMEASRLTMTLRRDIRNAPRDSVTVVIIGSSSGVGPTASATANKSDTQQEPTNENTRRQNHHDQAERQAGDCKSELMQIALERRGDLRPLANAAAAAPKTVLQSTCQRLAQSLARERNGSPFQRDLHEFGLAIARLTLGLVVVVLATRSSSVGPVGSLMFAVALAVGLTPELLPMITTVTLSRGALRMARRRSSSSAWPRSTTSAP